MTDPTFKTLDSSTLESLLTSLDMVSEQCAANSSQWETVVPVPRWSGTVGLFPALLRDGGPFPALLTDPISSFDFPKGREAFFPAQLRMVSLFPALIRDGGTFFPGLTGKVGLSRAKQGFGGTSHLPIRSGGTCRQSRWMVWGLISVQIQIQINLNQFRIHSCISLNTAVLFLDGIFVFFFSLRLLFEIQKTVNTWNISGMLIIVFSPIATKISRYKRRKKSQTLLT